MKNTEQQRSRQVWTQADLPLPPASDSPGTPPAESSPGGILQFPFRRKMKNVYAILDNKAKAIIGGLQLHSHEAAAIRTFTDIATTPNTMLQKHPEDFDLICLGHLDEDELHMVAMARHIVIMKGAAWKATQDAAPTTDTTR